MASADVLHPATLKHSDALRQDTHDSANNVEPPNQQDSHHQQRLEVPFSQDHTEHKLHFSDSDNLDQPIHLHEKQSSSSANRIQYDDSDSELHPEQTSKSTKSLSRLSGHAFPNFKSPPDTPAARTGPPRSLSFAYMPGSPSIMSSKHTNQYFQSHPEDQAPPDVLADLDADYSFTSNAGDKEFRTALEYRDQQERDYRAAKGKRRQQQRDRSSSDEGWGINPMKWFQESPKEEKPAMDFTSSPAPEAEAEAQVPEHKEEEGEQRPDGSELDGGASTSFFLRRPPKRGETADVSLSPTNAGSKARARMRRAFTVPHTARADDSHKEKGADVDHEGTTAESGMQTTASTTEKDTSTTPALGPAKWAKLRGLLPHLVHPNETILPAPSVVTSQAVNITDELITGGLSTLMLRLWFQRDEKGHRRVPLLFHRLRIRISDSLHPMERHGSVFRIECEYGSVARWVVYRELRDFLSLHAHYAMSNMILQNVDKMPEFPKTSLPYFKFLNKELREKGDGRRVGTADFARLQREALENYLINLIRAVMFHPSSNRLAGFLEISALSISLAQSGAQYKAGFLKIELSSNSGGGFGRKSTSWQEKKVSRWCSVRESYLVVLEEPGELEVWDVFLFDSGFKIERPKRYYRQGLGNLLHHDKTDEKSKEPQQQHKKTVEHQHGHGHANGDAQQRPTEPAAQPRLSTAPDSERRSVISSIKTRVSKIFQLDPSGCMSASGSRGASTSRIAGTHSDEDEADADVSDQGDDDLGSVLSVPSRPPTPMLDPSTNANPLLQGQGEEGAGKEGDEKGKEGMKKKAASDVSRHTFYVVNSQMRLKLVAKNERQMSQFVTALEKTAANSHYTRSNRFDSFSPIRMNVAAQWLVDGRDYFWNLSRAMLLAKESIYIHDWWLSPELQMRRPDKERYRLDKLLERKAKEGVKIYVILYQEVSNRTTPTDSNYAKQRLIGLHPNILVQRSPSHFQTGTFYWAHHEKMCVIDQTIAFMGGLDLCFGRWDTPQHVLTDDAADTDRSEIWPGKDYSNPRMSDFFNLNKPEEDMYDRTKVARMPWHDVAMQIVGQPARDLARHFVQRWNYLLRIKNHTRLMPFLLPPPEFRPGELSQMGLTGTCELQICRSAGPWSLGTPGKIEHSIQNAYLKAIQMSEHFVYIENQFFITSTVVNDVKIENNIGDAIVHRIIRAHKDGTPWKCCIMIPVFPGFTFPIDHSDASAIRIILECQNRTIARGPNSIFSRLRKEGIDPNEYFAVFSLRNWAKMRGDVLTTEQVYIHAKICIVDDRLAIIGSANINERSQKGDRDSELAAVIRDTDMIESTMAGKPFKVGRFAHTLRVRLMREHLGIDVDALDEEDLMTHDPVKPENEQEAWDPDSEQTNREEGGVTHIKKSSQKSGIGAVAMDAKENVNRAAFAGVETTSNKTAEVVRKLGLAHNLVSRNPRNETIEEERKDFNREGQKEIGFASSVVPTLEEKTIEEQRPPKEHIDAEKDHTNNGDRTIGDNHEAENGHAQNGDALPNSAPSELHTDDNVLFGAPANAKLPSVDNEPPARSLNSDVVEEEQAAPGAKATIKDNLGSKSSRKHVWTVPTKKPQVGPQDFEDPISDAFWKNTWVASAVHNTEIYRKVFHAVPDDLISTWKQYKEFVAYHERLNKPTRGSTNGEPVARIPSESGEEVAHEPLPSDTNPTDIASEMSKEEGEETPPLNSSSFAATQNEEPTKPRRPARGSEPFEKWERDEMEKLLGELNGQLVIYPNWFLEGEDIANNFLFNADRLLPLPIYT